MKTVISRNVIYSSSTGDNFMLKQFMQRLETVWVAITFAEAGEHETALQLLNNPSAIPQTRGSDSTSRRPPVQRESKPTAVIH
jgi:hypothetical protein